MDKKDKKILKAVLGKVLRKFTDEKFIIQDFAAYSKVLKQQYLNNQGLHRKKRGCAVIGCTEKSIQKSHAIPRSATLGNIAAHGHVLTPEFIYPGDYPHNTMAAKGLKDASTFPGYCVRHELLFESFEVDGKIDTAKKALLQTYRTICKERVNREIKLEINSIIREAYKNKIQEEAGVYLRSLLSKYPQFNDVNNLSVEGLDTVFALIERLDDYLSSPLEQFRLYETHIFSLLLNLSLKNDLIVSVVNVDFHLPVAICGFGNQTYMHNGTEHKAYLLVNVMPGKASTDIICVGLEKDKLILNQFLELTFDNPLNALNMIESFMVNGTDNWFINPDYWNNIPAAKQEKILHDILFTEDTYVDEYGISIFNDIRKKLLNVLEENISIRHDPITEYEKARIQSEHAKLNRTDFKVSKDAASLTAKLKKMLYKTSK